RGQEPPLGDGGGRPRRLRPRAGVTEERRLGRRAPTAGTEGVRAYHRLRRRHRGVAATRRGTARTPRPVTDQGGDAALRREPPPAGGAVLRGGRGGHVGHG